jgi:hypothetical protein
MTVVQRRSDKVDSDPYYDLDGAAAQRERSEHTRRRVLWRVVVGLAAVLLVLILARLPSVDSSTLVRGYGQPFLFGSLVVIAVACVLIFASSRRRASA